MAEESPMEADGRVLAFLASKLDEQDRIGFYAGWRAARAWGRRRGRQLLRAEQQLHPEPR